MADLVRLAIVYETNQAAASLRQLNTGLATVSTAHRRAGIAALTLAQSFETGSISAVGMAKSLGNVASVVFGPWGIALAFAAAILTFFTNKTAKAREAQEKFQLQLRDVKRRVDDLLGLGGEKTPFSTEIQQLTDQIDALDKKIQAASNSWGSLMRGGLALALTSMGFGNLAGAVLPGAPPEVGQRNALAGQRGRLTAPGAQAAAELVRYSRALEEQGRIFSALGAGPIKALQENIRLLQDHLERLSKIEGPEAAAAMQQTGAAITDLTQRLMRAERAAQLMEHGLFIMADAIEDFVFRGTFAFTDFLNNILRLLYRAATEDVIGGILQGVGRSGGGTATGTAGEPAIISGPGSVNPSVVSNVNLNVYSPDGATVAAWLHSNGDQLAGIVAGKIARSQGLRSLIGGGRG